MTDRDQALRERLLYLLQGKGAHMTFDDAVADFPPEMMNVRPPNVSYSPWHLVEHLRIAQRDILDYIRNPDYKALEWPQGYWPDQDAEADGAAWNASVQAFRDDLQAIQDIVADPETDLIAPIPHGYGGHNILREALIVADHNAYHVGELAILRQVLGAWPKDRGG